MRRNFTPEETQAILKEHYPWALEAKMDKPKCVSCDVYEVEEYGDVCDGCAAECEEADDIFGNEEEE